MLREIKPLPRRATTPESLTSMLARLLPGYAPSLTPSEQAALERDLPPDNDPESE